MSRGLKITFLIHAIVALVFGLLLYLQPGLWARMVNWAPFDPSLTRVYGAALSALAVSSWFGYRAARWDASPDHRPDGDCPDSAEHRRGIVGIALPRSPSVWVGQRTHLGGFCRGVDLLLRQSASPSLTMIR